MSLNQTTNSSAETEKIGEEIAAQLNGGDIVLLYGDLGAGKTTLTKGIVRGFGIDKTVHSPTFTLMNLFELKNQNAKCKNLVHIDTYRLKDEQELLDIGVEDYLGQADTVCIIEWPEKIEKLLIGKKCVEINLEHSANGRKIIMSAPRLI